MVYLILLFALITPQQDAPDLEAQFDLFTAWFEGEWDNNYQHKQDVHDKIEEPHAHLHSIFKRVEVPAVGNTVFFVKQYSDGDPSNVYRQRLYKMEVDRTELAIKTSIFAFNEEMKYRAADTDPALLASLTMDDLRGFPGCEVYWRYKDGAFHGKGKGDCTFISQRSGKKMRIKDDLILKENQFLLLENLFDEAGNFLMGRTDGVHFDMKKCQFFEGWTIFQKKENEKEYHVIRGIRMNDQGERIRLITAEGFDTGYEIELAQLVYGSGGREVPVLKLAVYEGDSTKSMFYLWSDPKAGRIGINHKWMQVGLTLENFESR